MLDCLAQVSRLDIVALAMVSKSHRLFAASHELWNMRFQLDNLEPYLYLLLHMYSDPRPGWFVLHPVQRRLKRVNLNWYPAPVEGSCFVSMSCGVFTIGGIINGKPTSKVTYMDCIKHTVYKIKPMKMARSGASASLVEDGKKRKIYVFGGCWDDVADYSNWVEVYDIETRIWELLSVYTPKMPLKIQQSMVMDEKHVYTVDEDGEIFIFSTSECMFVADNGEKESNPENITDRHLFCHTFFCRGIGGRILWRLPYELDWKEVKGLEELCGFDIIKCAFSFNRMSVFWQVPRFQGGLDQDLELWYAEISLVNYMVGEVREEVIGKIEFSAAVFSDSSYTSLNLLYAHSFFA